jgi:peptide/nickel transport system permease protein
MRPALRFVLTPPNLAGLLIVLAFLAIAIAAPTMAPYDDDPGLPPNFSRVGRIVDKVPHPPSIDAPLGTLGGQYSVYYTLIWGTRSALRLGILVALAAAALGVVIGASSGYAGGWLQRIAVPITDGFLAVPVIAGYWVVRNALFPSGDYVFLRSMLLSNPDAFVSLAQKIVDRLALDPLMITLILFSWMPYARITNSSTIRLREIEYVQAARALGASRSRILLRHIIPNLAAPVIVLAARDVGGTVMLAAAFAFMGIGGDLPWGEVLAIGRDWIIGPEGSLTAYWWTYAPVTAALVLFGIGWNLLGDGLNDLVAGRQSSTVIEIARREWFAPAVGLFHGLAAGLEARRALQAAREALSRGDHAEARRMARLASRLSPRWDSPWLILAAVSEPRAGLAYALRALEVNPDSEAARRAIRWLVRGLPNDPRVEAIRASARGSAENAVSAGYRRQAEVPFWLAGRAGPPCHRGARRAPQFRSRPRNWRL